MNIFGCVVKEPATEVVVCSGEQQIGQVAANRALRWAEGPMTPVLGLTTGSSPLAPYNELACGAEGGEVDLSRGIGSALDEYMGIDPENPLSYRQTVLCVVVEPLCTDPIRVCVPNGSVSDLAAAALEYDRVIAVAGGVDAQVLGIGSNGHIGFSEPTSSFASHTRAETLTEQTCVDNARLFGEGERVPTHCVIRGLGTIMEARHVAIVVTGRHKVRVVIAMIEGPVVAMCLAPIFQFYPSALVVVDEAVATGLNHTDYSRHIIDILI